MAPLGNNIVGKHYFIAALDTLANCLNAARIRLIQRITEPAIKLYYNVPTW